MIHETARERDTRRSPTLATSGTCITMAARASLARSPATEVQWHDCDGSEAVTAVGEVSPASNAAR